MSFCTGTKNELCNPKYNKKSCCADAFLTGVLLFSQLFTKEKIVLASDCEMLLESTVSFLRRLTGIEVSEKSVSTRADKTIYRITVMGQSVALIYEAVEAMDVSMNKGGILEKQCDRLAFLRGAFCAAGYVADPSTSYHLEINAPNAQLCELVADICESLGLQLKTVVRRSQKMNLYMKSSEEIFEFLSQLGASGSSLRLMEEKVIKEVRNDVNRRVNFETANLLKTASASAEQIAAIEKIQSEKGLEWLPEHLQKLAKLRLENPDLSLAQLGELVEPKMSRSGVNHRLRKIVELSKS